LTKKTPNSRGKKVEGFWAREEVPFNDVEKESI
jgi:hypothetical protein